MQWVLAHLSVDQACCQGSLEPIGRLCANLPFLLPSPALSPTPSPHGRNKCFGARNKHFGTKRQEWVCCADSSQQRRELPPSFVCFQRATDITGVCPCQSHGRPGETPLLSVLGCLRGSRMGILQQAASSQDANRPEGDVGSVERATLQWFSSLLKQECLAQCTQCL